MMQLSSRRERKESPARLKQKCQFRTAKQEDLMHLRKIGVTLAATGLMVSMIPIAQAAVGTDSSALRAAVKLPAIRAHQQALDKIANKNGGTRASGTPGFGASV